MEKITEENLFTPDCIRTFSGRYMNVFKPTVEMICIEDIAHALSNQGRFGGHLPNFFSVAQHSLNCSYMVETPNLKLAALLHDASEAYLLDIPSPIKSGLTNYKTIEDGLMAKISELFGFEYPLHEEVKKVDAIMLQVEWRGLMLRTEGFWLPNHDIHKTKTTFLEMFKYYQSLV